MAMNRIGGALCGGALFFLLPQAARGQLPPVAPIYRTGGGFVTGDFGWLRGSFADANANQRRQWAVLAAWLDRRRTARTDAIRAQLAEAGIAAPTLRQDCYGEEPCTTIAFARDTVAGIPSWSAFAAALAEARPIAQSYIFATRNAEETVAARPDAPLAERLRAAIVGEQILRLAMGWGQGTAADAPSLSAHGRAIVRMLVWQEVVRRDRANRNMLKSAIADGGWPTISRVGGAASGAAWLLIQHADEDPAFQLQALRLMESLSASGEVRRQNYAYLYDRVMLALTGRQRYATQFRCVNGRRGPQPLENEADIDTIRALMELGTLSEYRSQMDRMFGATCSE